MTKTKITKRYNTQATKEESERITTILTLSCESPFKQKNNSSIGKIKFYA